MTNHHTSPSADAEEELFLMRCRQELLNEKLLSHGDAQENHELSTKVFLTKMKYHPLTTQELPRAQPCQGRVPTHHLEFGPITKQYYVMPIVPEYERGDPR